LHLDFFMCLRCFFINFFFSSRRRHTRSKRDWSSDVCSSDLYLIDLRLLTKFRKLRLKDVNLLDMLINKTVEIAIEKEVIKCNSRSEERRVGKECRHGLRTYQSK